jgi:hypothetical protein
MKFSPKTEPIRYTDEIVVRMIFAKIAVGR